jgi:hypothetical protein
MEKENNSFFVTVNRDAISAPLLETKEASSIEIRNPDGTLAILIVMVPGHPVLFKSAADTDDDFEQFCKNMGFNVRKPKQNNEQ